MATSDTDDVVTVYRTADSLNAHALAAQLVDEGIDARVVGDFLSGAYGGVTGTMTQVEVWIPAAQRDQAAPLIARWSGEDEPVPTGSKTRFRYSLMTLLGVATVIAFVGGARPIPESETKSLAVLIAINLMLWIGFIYAALRRRRMAKNPPPTPRATPLD